MDNDTNSQPQTNDPYVPLSQPPQPMPDAGAPNPQQPAPPQGQPTPQAPQAQQPQQSQQNQRPPLRIDHNLLAELGLAALPEEEKKALEKHIYETLEMRVGMRLADQMTNEQLDEFETYFNARDDAGAFRWLETNFPNYKDIVADEFDKLKGEVASQAPAILAASQQQAAEAPQPQTAPDGTPQQPQMPPQQQPAQPQAPHQPTEQPQMPQPPQPPQPQPAPQQWPTPVPPPVPPSDQQQQPPQSPTQ
jgi:hypothetical protein